MRFDDSIRTTSIYTQEHVFRINPVKILNNPISIQKFNVIIKIKKILYVHKERDWKLNIKLICPHPAYVLRWTTLKTRAESLNQGAVNATASSEKILGLAHLMVFFN